MLLYLGVGRQQQCPMASPVRSQSKRPSNSNSQGETLQKTLRGRRPNWNLNEMIALVDVKREEFLEELDFIDGRDLMDSEVTK